ncbi:EAL domain-containing protein [Ligilactobacillus saerimneri]|uniref:EAL domain-containing protein n=1 Tax=Ligilactobacillus saerimneri TaxID=228229 RepID=A0A7H9EHL0_9LACO|nr:EAL domain-containing protein [Ligilactobacillus saerimneri]QLL77170.1 EAL domain-containing protein [Ligilactobacillus saerimneri]
MSLAEVKDLTLYCQPIYRVTGVDQAQVVDYELLLRQTNGQAVAVEQLNYWMSVAERRKQMRAWVISELETFFDAHPEVILNLNIDPWQFIYPDSWDYLNELQRLNKQLHLEITERNSAGTKLPHFTDLLDNLKQREFVVSLDDVGSGYNSLQTVLNNSQYLDRIKFSLLIFGQKDHSSEILFAQAWQDLACRRGLEMVVEGVECPCLVEELIQCHCQLQQGFYWQKPLPLRAITSKIHS